MQDPMLKLLFVAVASNNSRDKKSSGVRSRDLIIAFGILSNNILEI